MEVKVNQTIVSIPASSTLLGLLQQELLAEKTGIAVAVNNTVIPKKDWVSKELNESDSITIIHATQGG